MKYPWCFTEDGRALSDNQVVALSLLDEIERDALDDRVPVATALRKCIALGGRSGSEALRDWAARELDGYHGVEDLPDYRVLPAVIQLDAFTGRAQISGQSVPPSWLPDFARERIKEGVHLRDGIAQIEDLSKQSEIKLGLPGGGDLAAYMNAHANNPFQHIDRLYWALSPVSVAGVVHHVRNALVKLVAEIRASTPAGQELPSAEAANQAMQFVVTGRRAKVNVTTAQASGSGTTASVAVPPPPTQEAGFWTTSRRIGAVAVGAATIAGAVFAAIQVF